MHTSRRVVIVGLVIACSQAASCQNLFPFGQPPGGNPTPQPEPFEPDPAGVQLVEDMIARLPGSEAAVEKMIDAADGPEGSLLGFELDNGQKVFVQFGETDDGPMLGLATFDDDGRFVVGHRLTKESITAIASSGDGTEFSADSEGNVHVLAHLAATDPPSVIAVVIHSDGTVTPNDRRTIIHDSLDPGYMTGPTGRYKCPPIMPPGASAKAPGDLNCGQISDILLDIAGGVCGIIDIIKSTARTLLVTAFCNEFGLAIDAYADRHPEANARVIGALQFGLTVGCEIAGAVLDAGAQATGVGLACLLFNSATSLVETATGRDMSDVICCTIGVTDCCGVGSDPGDIFKPRNLRLMLSRTPDCVDIGGSEAFEGQLSDDCGGATDFSEYEVFGSSDQPFMYVTGERRVSRDGRVGGHVNAHSADPGMFSRITLAAMHASEESTISEDFTVEIGACSFQLTVMNGSGSGRYDAGEQVSIVANEPPAGQQFDRWEGEGVADPSSPATTVVVDSDRVISARFQPCTVPPCSSMTCESDIENLEARIARFRELTAEFYDATCAYNIAAHAYNDCIASNPPIACVSLREGLEALYPEVVRLYYASQASWVALPRCPSSTPCATVTCFGPEEGPCTSPGTPIDSSAFCMDQAEAESTYQEWADAYFACSDAP